MESYGDKFLYIWFLLLDIILVRVVHAVVSSNSLFPLLFSIPEYDYINIYLSILLLVDISVVSDLSY